MKSIIPSDSCGWNELILMADTDNASKALELLLRAKKLREDAGSLRIQAERAEAEARKCLNAAKKTIQREVGSKIVWLE
jgi:hypothetical protein